MVSFRKAFNDDYFSNIFMFEVQKNSGYTSKISITHFAARNWELFPLKFALGSKNLWKNKNWFY